jgi:hypothetical protein
MTDSQAGAALTAVGVLSHLALRAPLPLLHLTGSLKRASRSTPAHTAPNRSGTHLFLNGQRTIKARRERALFPQHPRKIRDPDVRKHTRTNRAELMTCAPFEDSPARNLPLPTRARYRVKACGSKPLFQRRSLPSTPHCAGQRVIQLTNSNHSL